MERLSRIMGGVYARNWFIQVRWRPESSGVMMVGSNDPGIEGLPVVVLIHGLGRQSEAAN